MKSIHRIANFLILNRDFRTILLTFKPVSATLFCRSHTRRLFRCLRVSINERKVFNMEKITSFTIDHIKLQPGVYVSRKDKVGAETLTTFDLRMTSPNEEPVMNTAEVHTIEHLGATFLRNHPDYKEKTVYFGPMGCRTGFYLILAGDYESRDIVPLMIEMYEFIRDYKDEVPGASPMDCGNYLDMNLPMTNYLAARYLDNVLFDIEDSRLIYPV